MDPSRRVKEVNRETTARTHVQYQVITDACAGFNGGKEGQADNDNA